MLILLPPSETKRDGGRDRTSAVFGSMSFGALESVREGLVDDVVAFAADPGAMMRGLKLGPRLAAEVDRNAALRTAPVMPALDRYTGVLYDALDAPSLDAEAREFARDSVAVHSALFGLVGAMDEIPAYRLSHDSRIPGARLKARWRAVIAEALQAFDGLVVDLRSEGYVDLGPAPARDDSVFLRVVAEDGTGRRRALNHFNKRAKGLFTRALLLDRPSLGGTADLLAWSAEHGFRLDADGRGERSSATKPAELELVA
ncbi:YaaA family protein [Agromyces sp. LHK192]|uniref:YaaA family protein n=1 Tax=Agromyces sp. LHK192 TaxID=2498704 RepID=UPI000FD9ADDD|nr:peroxide stress protein YaaA [Agromyces sp. LHK192]